MNQKIILLLLAAAGILLLLVFLFFQSPPEKVPIEILNRQGEHIPLLVEIADSESERAQGLMFRDSLGENEGMLFIYSDARPRAFWMKNTRIPLEAIYIDSNYAVVDLIRMEPCHRDPCRTYPSEVQSQYVLEVSSNFSRLHGISIGDRIEIERSAG